MDQASKLRELVKGMSQKNSGDTPKLAKAICVTSGKGGVGKSNISLSIGILLAKKGKKVCMIDADFSLANLHLLLGFAPKNSLYNYIKGNVEFSEVVSKTDYENLSIVPASSGIEEMADLSDYEIKRIISGFSQIEQDYDYIIIDTAAGIHQSVMKFVYSSSITILVATPETTSMTDAYALYKVALNNKSESDIVLLVNMADSDEEGKFFVTKFNAITKKYLNRSPKLLGILRRDSELIAAVKEQIPIVEYRPKGLYTNLISQVCDVIVNNTIGSEVSFTANFFS